MKNAEVIYNLRAELQKILDKNGWKFKFRPPVLKTKCVTYVEARDVNSTGNGQNSIQLLDCNRELHPNDENQLKSLDELLKYARPRLINYALRCGLSEKSSEASDFDPVKALIEKYKIHLRTEGLKEEQYKWELIEQYKGRPDVSAPDLNQEVKDIKYANLIYHNGIAVMRHLAKDLPEAYRSCLRMLFDESKPLSERIDFYSTETLRLYRELEPDETRGHHQDERTMATLLALHNPDKHPLYKDSFYQKYCSLIGEKTEEKGRKYIHYQSLIDKLISDYIKPDTELINLVQSLLPDHAFKDSNHKILAQDILYLMLDQAKPEIPDSENETDELITPQLSQTMQIPLNQILFGPPGTGKTYTTINKALEIIDENTAGKSREELKAIYDEKITSGQIVFTTFHQSMNYEDFIEGIKPETLDGKVIYTVKPGIFKELCNSAQTPNQVDFNYAYESFKKDLSEMDGQLFELKTPTGKPYALSLNSNDNLSLHTGTNKSKQGVLTKENLQKQLNGEPKFVGWDGYFKGVINHLKEKYNYSQNGTQVDQNFVLIIDEINRGNVSQIFGELITLIEEDKRLGKPEQLEVMLPYSKEKFGIPANLYILGTMNTADRSVEALDAALRRRFSFVEMPPKYDLEELNTDVAGHKLSEILLKINRRIEKLLSKDNLIGHSYFLDVKTSADLRAAFQNKIIPLLQEYFYGDFGKIGLILGSGFVKTTSTESDTIFADFGDYDISGLAEKEIYHLVNVLDENEMPEDAFEAALHVLMK